MSEHPIGNLMTETMAKIKEMVDVNTIIGSPITAADGTTVIPVSRVSFGFGAGGSVAVLHAGSQELMGHNGVASIDDLGVVTALVEHAHIKSQHVGKIHGAPCAAFVRADDHHVVTVNLKVCLVLQQVL